MPFNAAFHLHFSFAEDSILAALKNIRTQYQKYLGHHVEDIWKSKRANGLNQKGKVKGPMCTE